MGLQYTDAFRRLTVATLVTATTETATFTSGTATLPAGVKGDAAVLVNMDGDTAGTGSSASLQVQSSPHGAAVWSNVGAAVAAAITGTAFRGAIPFDSGDVTLWKPCGPEPRIDQRFPVIRGLGLQLRGHSLPGLIPCLGIFGKSLFDLCQDVHLLRCGYLDRLRDGRELDAGVALVAPRHGAGGPWQVLVMAGGADLRKCFHRSSDLTFAQALISIWERGRWPF